MAMSTDKYTKKGYGDWLDQEMSTLRFHKLIAVYNQMRIAHNCGSVNKMPESALYTMSIVYRPNVKNKKAAMERMKTLLRMDRVKKVANEQLIIAMEKNGITPDWLVKKRKEVVDGAMKKESYTIVNDTLTVLEEYAGVFDTVTEHSEEAQDTDWEKIDEKADSDKPKELKESAKKLSE